MAENLPLGTSAPVKGIMARNETYNESDKTGYETQDTALITYDRSKLIEAAGTSTDIYIEGTSATDPDFPNRPNITVDLTAATAATIGQLYESFAIQDLLQTDARGGTRYVELINAHFGVTSPDFRLQRPEYIGGGSYPFIVSPLAQTSETSTTELGTLAATATATIDGVGFLKSFVEHGWIIGLMCVRADLTYQQGLHRTLSRDTRYDFYFPALANLGEQEVLNKEIYAQGSADLAADAAVFGYQERWSELRYGKSMFPSHDQMEYFAL